MNEPARFSRTPGMVRPDVRALQPRRQPRWPKPEMNRPLIAAVKRWLFYGKQFETTGPACATSMASYTCHPSLEQRAPSGLVHLS